MKKYILAVLALFIITATTACYNVSEDKANDEKIDSDVTFSQARENFETNLIKQNNDQYEIPIPPEGIFDLVYYESDVGDLAAYVSSDPMDGEKHPLIIWVVGGWSNGISYVPWSYPDWENDQTGSAFREAGVLMMYPSFRGANGNPGYYETMFGEINDIVSAYEFAASLDYVDPDRIYLGGHSTGGTRSLLASAYTDKFRSVFSFGPVDDIINHNQSQFTFNLSDNMERRLRSPIHWLKDINTPTFIIEGIDGNSSELKNIEKNSNNENIYCYVVEDADHFNVLAPITKLLAQKILNDTGNSSNISLNLEEIQAAMKQNPVEPLPIMVPFDFENFSFLMPATWFSDFDSDNDALYLYSEDFGYEDNFWDTSILTMYFYTISEGLSYEEFIAEYSGYNAQGNNLEINGITAYVLSYTDEEGDFNKVAAFINNEELIYLMFSLPVEYKNNGDLLFETMINSLKFQ